MNPDAVLIQQPAVDFATLLGLTFEALGYSTASAADASRRELCDAERYLSCLAAISDPKATAGLSPSLLSHVSLGVLVAAEKADLLPILAAAAGMPFVSAATVVPGIHIAVISGTLAQWRDAVKSGTQAEGGVRFCYCKIMVLFERAGLGHVWGEFVKKPTPDRLFLLEDKRK